MMSVAPSRWAAATTRSPKVMQAKSQPLARASARQAGGLARALGSRKVARTAIGASGRHRAGAIGGGDGPGRTVCQLLLSLRFLRFFLKQKYEPFPADVAEALAARSCARALSPTARITDGTECR